MHEKMEMNQHYLENLQTTSEAIYLKGIGHFCSHVDFVQIHDTQLRGKDVWVGGYWDLETLDIMLPDFIQNHFLDVLLYLNEEVMDGRV
ncbi:hypothetical protein RJT34_24979 [Clitoria ternatea]|uniref:Uncharacterized protein n=1 Tax=Clitoria ternatea TaxID=43366 RepID=A0AAN9FX99_CLITE